jgi:hypothetical protein
MYNRARTQLYLYLQPKPEPKRKKSAAAQPAGECTTHACILIEDRVSSLNDPRCRLFFDEASQLYYLKYTSPDVTASLAELCKRSPHQGYDLYFKLLIALDHASMPCIPPYSFDTMSNVFNVRNQRRCKELPNLKPVKRLSGSTKKKSAIKKGDPRTSI